MNQTIQALNPVTMPLDGQHLIEASAGTGKTFSITKLFLRLLLEQDARVEEILLVTFTTAATHELRHRLFQELSLASALLDARENDLSSAEEMTAHIVTTAVERFGEDHVRLVLRTARLSLDTAAIHTIHGFCQRALNEEAFDSGVLFTQGDLVDDGELLEQIFSDQITRLSSGSEALSPGQLKQLIDAKSTVFFMASPARQFMGIKVSLPDVSNADEIGRQQERLRSEIQALLAAGAAQEASETLIAYGGLYANSYPPKKIATELTDLQQAFKEDNLTQVLATISQRYGYDNLEAKKKKAAASVPDLPLFHILQQYACLTPRLEALEQREFGQGMEQLANAMAKQLKQRKAQQQLYSYDDIVLNLAVALSRKDSQLHHTLSQRWPWALVDEFQDTDMAQFHIFSEIYQQGDHAKGLVMIGDPKQSIYGFRGADIYSYLRAAGDIPAQQQFTLLKNWRSHSVVVDSVNAIFGAVERPFALNAIGFTPAQANTEQQGLSCEKYQQAGTVFWQLSQGERSKVLSKEQAMGEIAKAVAAEVSRLLHVPVQQGDQQRQLVPGDIAVLVNKHYEGAAIEAALQAAGIPSVTHSQESVWASEEARELQTLLAAMANPFDPGRVSSALTTLLWSYSLDQLYELRNHGDAWSKQITHFHQWNQIWLSRGILAALISVLQERASHLLDLPMGERRMTNWLHMAELLQEREQGQARPEYLSRWLYRQIQTADGRKEDQQQRLESDEDCVQIMTVHASKGLEFDIVFLPFAMFSTERSASRQRLCIGRDNQGGSEAHIVDFGSERYGVLQEAADMDGLSERLRLLYVGLTRARYRNYCCWGPVNLAQKSALAWLLHGEQASLTRLNDENCTDALQCLADHTSSIVVDNMLSVEVEVSSNPRTKESKPSLAARKLAGLSSQHWRVWSFTSLSRLYEAETVDAFRSGQVTDAVEQSDVADESGFVPEFNAESELEPVIDVQIDEIPVLPAGPVFGTCVHDILEHLLPGDPESQESEELIQSKLLRYGYSDDKNQPAYQVARQLVINACYAQLPEGLRLADLPKEHCLAEMGFYFSLSEPDQPPLADLLKQYPQYESAYRVLSTPSKLRGVLNGLIDLVYYHQGRYYLADYKTNVLGSSEFDYGDRRLQHAIQHSAYDLQYLIYSLALHRYLKDRLGADYSYEQQFGGVRYLFLRGMRPGQEQGIFADRPPEALIMGLDRLFGGAY